MAFLVVFAGAAVIAVFIATLGILVAHWRYHGIEPIVWLAVASGFTNGRHSVFPFFQNLTGFIDQANNLTGIFLCRMISPAIHAKRLVTVCAVAVEYGLNNVRHNILKGFCQLGFGDHSVML